MKITTKKSFNKTLKPEDIKVVIMTAACIFAFLFLQWATFLIGIFPSRLIVNWLLVLPVFGAALLAIRRLTPALLVSSLLTFFLFYLNEYVYFSRHTYIQFNDVFCIGDALSVSDNYPLYFSLEILLKLLLNIGVCVLMIVLERKLCGDSFNKKKAAKAIVGGGVTVIPIALVTIYTLTGVLNVRSTHFNINEYTEQNGLPFSLYSEYLQSRLKTPDGYSEEAVQEILSAYSADDYDINAASGGANVIVIMNEALADYSLLGETDFSADPLKELHSLGGNTASGKMTVSVYGGYTCNTEFEFLTGIPMACLPSGALPFLQYINRSTPSICTDLAEMGFVSEGIHPYYSQEWRRSSVYDQLGFQNTIFGQDFSDEYVDDIKGNITDTTLTKADFGSDLEYIRGFISDRECYDKVYERLNDNIANGKKSFIFAVTVQNHGGYLYDGDDFKQEVYVDENAPSSGQINQYLTCSSLSSKAFSEFTEKLADCPEKVIVLMFGDHQPGLPDIEQHIELDSDGKNELCKTADRYTVPYIMWSNFETDWSGGTDTVSPNYLSAVLKKSAGLPLNEWDKFRLEALEQYPAVTTQFSVDSSGEFLPTDSAMSEDIMRKYNYLAYNRLF